MQFSWPNIEWREEVMREGMQIESTNISVADKVALLNALSETGLPTIVVGSFVSPKYTPQMAQIEKVLEAFTPLPNVKYTALLVNERSYERAQAFSPPLTINDSPPVLSAHLCDIFTRRNFNRSQETEFQSWPKIVATAKEQGAERAEIRVAAAWGSNFIGEFTPPQRTGHGATCSLCRDAYPRFLVHAGDRRYGWRYRRVPLLRYRTSDRDDRN